jgi:hypothetical protein
MIAFGLYLTAVLCGTSGLLGHAPLLPRLARRAYRRLTNTPSRVTPNPPDPADGHVQPRPSWSRP